MHSHISHTYSIGNLQFLEELQQGASGRVFVAKHIPTDSLVAVKQIPFQSLMDSDRYTTERNTAMAISHTNIVKTLGSTYHKGHGYLVMELLHQDLLEEFDSFQSEDEIRILFQQICKAVAFLHDHKIAHLDIKPENVLLDEAGKAKLCDFGSSHSFYESIQCEIGTLLYRAPEILFTSSFDKASADIWSLGVVLYLLLTGEYPYSGSTDEELHDSVKSGVFCTKALTKANVSDEAKALTLHMLQLDPNNRPSIFQVLRHPFCFFI